MKNQIRTIGRWAFEVRPDQESLPCFDKSNGNQSERLAMTMKIKDLIRRGPWYQCHSCGKKRLEWDDAPNGLIDNSVVTKILPDGKKIRVQKMQKLGLICTACELEHYQARLRGHIPKPASASPGEARAVSSVMGQQSALGMDAARS